MDLYRLPDLASFGYDGYAALKALLENSAYGSIDQAVAALTLFSHPDTVRQTGMRGIFRTVRGPAAKRGLPIAEKAGLAGDDNKSPTDAFMWANGLRLRPRDLQFNHIVASSRDPELYTNLTNLCATPSFLAKLTDTDSGVKALLRYRSFELYGLSVTNPTEPPQPAGYNRLQFAPCLPVVEDVAGTIRAIMSKRPKDRTVDISNRFGWLFAQPDGP